MFAPWLHCHFEEWWPTIQKLIVEKIPTAVVGGSWPDKSKEQDQKILTECGANVITKTIDCPFRMSMGEISKCNHVIVFAGGHGKADDMKTRIRINLAAADIMVR